MTDRNADMRHILSQIQTVQQSLGKHPNLLESDDSYRSFVKRYQEMGGGRPPSREQYQSSVDYFAKYPTMSVLRGIHVSKKWLENLNPSVPLGIYWTQDWNIATTFADTRSLYDERFKLPEGETVNLIIEADISTTHVDLESCIVSAWATGEQEITMMPGAPLRVTHMWLSQGWYSTGKPIEHLAIGKTFKA